MQPPRNTRGPNHNRLVPRALLGVYRYAHSILVMPVYHYIFHAHGSWMPDRAEGYFKHGSSWQAPNKEAAKQYYEMMQDQPVSFDAAQQRQLIDAAIKAQSFQQVTLYAAATDATHVHLVAAWEDERDPVRIRSGLKSSLTRSLNSLHGKRDWFVAKAGQSPVCDQKHLNKLVHDYLPKHELYWYYKQANGM